MTRSNKQEIQYLRNKISRSKTKGLIEVMYNNKLYPINDLRYILDHLCIKDMIVVKTVNELLTASENAKSVYVLHYHKRKPAAFMISMQARQLIKMINNQLIYRDNE